MTKVYNIGQDITITLTNERTIKAYDEVLRVEQKLDELRELIYIAYEDAFIRGEGYDRTDFYDILDVENEMQGIYYDALAELMAC